MRIVLIDDDSTSIFLMRMLLQLEELADSITSFQSAQEALRYLRQSPPDQRPDIILLDLNMPFMSGWDFLAAIAAEADDLLSNCRIYILTSSLAQTDSQRAGANPLVTRLIPKPLNQAELQLIKAEVSGLGVL